MSLYPVYCLSNSHFGGGGGEWGGEEKMRGRVKHLTPRIRRLFNGSSASNSKSVVQDSLNFTVLRQPNVAILLCQTVMRSSLNIFGKNGSVCV